MTTANASSSRPDDRAARRLAPPLPGAAPIREIVAARRDGVILVLGAPDTGKTTWCVEAAHAAHAAGRRVAIVDADSGQSEIGPPTTLGLAMIEDPFARMSDLRPRALAFIGSTSPSGYLLEWVIGVRSLVDRARVLGAETILVDMPGLVTGPIGMRLHQAVAEAIRPDACIALERSGELRAPLRGFPPCVVERPGVAKAVRAKTPVVRKLRRSVRFGQYFKEAREFELPADCGIVRGGSLLLGRPMRPPAMEALQQNLSTRLVHVEEGVDGVRAIASGAPTFIDRAVLARRFGRRRVHWLEESQLESLIVGLLDDRGETVAVGSLLGVDFSRRMLRIASPWLDPDAIRGFIWGTARAGVDGVEREPLKRGDV